MHCTQRDRLLRLVFQVTQSSSSLEPSLVDSVSSNRPVSALPLKMPHPRSHSMEGGETSNRLFSMTVTVSFTGREWSVWESSLGHQGLPSPLRLTLLILSPI